ncbi:MAG: WD40 repeat domain-containing serine/threonine protein kinase [Acidimicrobiales bacterium]
MVEELDLGIEGLSRYKEVGSGGFATVYVAWDAGFRRWVAVKVLHSLDDDGRRRFDRERGLMGQLDDHINVVTPYRFGLTNTSQPYLIMEYLRGGSLEDLINNDGPRPWPEAVDYLLPIASALGRAHSEGILHRDVKPANILLTGSGVSKLTDFGISDIRGATQTQIAFTLAHVAPETFSQGTDLRDERSDLYSLSSTLYYLISGRAPFDVDGQDSPFAYMNRLTTLEPPALEETPTELRGFFRRSLAKDPEQRHRTAAQFIEELSRIRAGPEERLVIVPDDKTRPSFTKVGGVVLAAAALAIVVFFSFARLVPTPTPDRVFLFGHTNNVSEIVELPDDRLASASDDTTVHVWNVDEPDTPVVVFDDHTDKVFTLEILQDGRVASASADGTVRVWDAENSDEAVTFDGHAGEVWDVQELSDGRLVSAGQDGTAQVWNPDDVTAEPLTLVGHTEQIFGFTVLADDRIATASGDDTVRVWDPNLPLEDPIILNGHTDDARGVFELEGSQLLATFGDDLTIRIWDLAEPQTAQVVLRGHEGFILSALELADGRIASSSSDGTVRIWDISSAGPEVAVLEYHNADVYSLLQLSDGRLVSSGKDRTVKIWDPAEPDVEPLSFTGHTEEVWSLTPLSDGRIASSGADDVVRVWNPDTAT